MSCQGGDEHIFSNPIVGITYSGKCYYEFQNQLRLLLEDQFLYFSINLKLSSSYVTSKKKRVIWENVYVEFSKKEIPPSLKKKHSEPAYLTSPSGILI